MPLLLPTPTGDLLVTAGGAKRPKLIVLASEIGKTVTGSTKLAIARPNSGDCGSMTLAELREKASGWGGWWWGE